METLAFLLGITWASIGVVGAFATGRGYLWRAAIIMGPLFFVLSPADES